MQTTYIRSASDIPLASGHVDDVGYLQWLVDKGFSIDKRAMVFPKMGECISACQ